MSIDELVKAVQSTLNVTADGKPGVETWTAIYNKIVGKQQPKIDETVVGVTVDPRSEKNIATLHPKVQSMAKMLIEKAQNAGIQIKVISGTRTYDEQNDLYAQGRSKPGSVVTNARGGYSNHNFGIAFDIGVFEGSKYIPESSKYKAVGALGTQIGLEWGGNWKSIKDEPHFQLRPTWAQNLSESQMLSELRTRKANNTDAFKA